MRAAIFLLFLLSYSSAAEELCPSIEWSVLNPNARWGASDFSKRSAQIAIDELSANLKAGGYTDIFRVADLQSIYMGYILLENVRKTKGKNQERAIGEYCGFISKTPIRENS
ncbi:hypothetical protein ACJJIE_23035 [Microbulbifer sp. TRSA001]|uniref:hypothetical protein n=1 Tax=unclassified Microbulbifer TaxID=2619833 RepID=UPI0024AC96D7|nr:hypothetical protein [Microbulbifer sp. VAAF005]WHI46108.1 hypothetical protein P0078_20680 [Microbulbifer sp. VAAF005]